MHSKILILANSSGGLYNFRRELIAQLAQMGSISVSVPDYGRVCELEELVAQIAQVHGKKPLDPRLWLGTETDKSYDKAGEQNLWQPVL